MTNDTCSWSARDDVFEGYVRGELGPEDRDAFEDHYFSCASCLARLRAYDGLHAEIGTLDAEVPETRPGQARPWRWTLVPVAAGLVLLVAAALWLRIPAPPVPESTAAVGPTARPPADSQLPAPPATQTPPAGARVEAPLAQAAPSKGTEAPVPAGRRDEPQSATPPVVALNVLARVAAPPYAPATLRGPQDDAAAKFGAAMRLYVKRDYAGAIPGLAAAAALRPDVPHYAFFLAVCDLMTDRVEPAVTGLQQTIAIGESPYLEEAHFYLAKARLRQGDVRAAREELELTIERHGRLEADARKLLAGVNALPEKR
jgi:hypothetical protein